MTNSYGLRLNAGGTVSSGRGDPVVGDSGTVPRREGGGPRPRHRARDRLPAWGDKTRTAMCKGKEFLSNCGEYSLRIRKSSIRDSSERIIFFSLTAVRVLYAQPCSRSP